MVVDSLIDAVAGARRTPGRLETGGVPSKSPATTLLSLWPSVFWDFGSVYQKALRRHLLRAVAAAVFSSCRCGDSGFVSRHKPAEHHIAMFLHPLSVQNFLMDVLHMSWGFESLCQWRCGACCADCWGSGNLFLPVVAAPLLPAVVAAAIDDSEDVAASVVPAVAASAVDITACSLTQNWLFTCTWKA